MLSRFGDFWTSDNTDAYNRLFRFDSDMMGTLGVGCNLLKLSEEELNICKYKIAKYKEIRHIVQEGKFYRLQGNLVYNDYMYLNM